MQIYGNYSIITEFACDFLGKLVGSEAGDWQLVTGCSPFITAVFVSGNESV